MTAVRRPATATALVATVLVAVAGCSTGASRTSALTTSADDIPAYARQLAAEPRTFTDTLHIAGHTWVVRGTVADDFRYAATVSVDGRPAYDEVDVDDARWLRVDDAATLFPADVLTRLQATPAVARVLSGGWVTDPAGAPNDLDVATDVVPLDPSYVLATVHVLDLLGTRLRGMREYNVDAIYYLPKDDKFPAHREDGKRFDAVPPKQYDVEHPPATLAAIDQAFEYDSVWLRPAGITRIERLVALPGPRDALARPIERAVSVAGAPRLRALLATATPGALEAETLVFRPDPGASISAPSGATVVDLRAVLRLVKAAVAGVSDPAPVYGPVDGPGTLP